MHQESKGHHLSLPKAKAREVGKLLSTIMRQRGLSLRDVEKGSGVSDPVIWSLINEQRLTNATLIKIKAWAAKLPKLERAK